MCVSSYFCFVSFCLGSNCSVYSGLMGLGISEPYCLPSHCRRAGIAEACYHTGSGDQSLVLRLCSPHLFTFWASPSLQLGWFHRWKAEKSCPDSWCRNQLFRSTNPPISLWWDCLCNPELRKCFFYRLVWRLPFKSPVCARIYMNLQVHLCVPAGSRNTSLSLSCSSEIGYLPTLQIHGRVRYANVRSPLIGAEHLHVEHGITMPQSLGNMVMGLFTAAKPVVQGLDFPGTRLAGTSCSSCPSSSKTHFR